MVKKLNTFFGRVGRWMRLGLGVLLVVGVSASVAQPWLAQAAPEAWVYTGSLGTGRSEHQALLLLNGKVLVAGGRDGSSNYLTGTELYDPATGVWSATGSLDQGRIDHTLTMLPGGRVLLVGGNNTKVYDPATGVWGATGALNTLRSGHTATLLPNGKVLVVGGYGSSTFLSSAELYDPTTGLWTTTGALSAPRSRHTAIRLQNGKVLVIGGSDGRPTEVYDPATGAWQITGSITNRRNWGHATVLLPNGKVLLVGGAYYDTDSGFYVYPSNIELYDPATGTWSLSGQYGGGSYFTATLLPNGKVMVAGGYWYQFDPPGLAHGLLAERAYWQTYYSSVSVYEPATGTWSSTDYMGAARGFHTATVLPTGRVLVAGGRNGSGDLSSAELSDVYPYAYWVYWPFVVKQ